MSPLLLVEIELLARQAADGAAAPVLPQQSLDFSTYPTTPLQQFAIFIIFFFPAVSILLVSLRIYDRLTTKTFGPDDVFITVATILAAVESLFSFAMIKLQNLGIHVWMLPATQYDPRNSMIVNYIVVMLYNPELALVKSSVLFFLLRLGGFQTWFRRSIQVLNFCNIGLLIAVLFASIFTCVPVQKYWNRTLAGHCNNEPYQYLITSGLTVLTDVLVLIIPIKIVIGLQVTKKVKIILICLLGSGIVVTVFSILRMRAIYSLYYPPPNPKDPTYNIDFVYSTIECNLAIITATIPPLRGLMKKWFPRMFTSRGASGKNSGYQINSGLRYGGGSRGFQTIGGGGGSVALDDLKSPARTKHSRLGSLTNSEEEILGNDRNITRTTAVQITYEETGEKDMKPMGRSWVD